jgi:hypothetical protein
MGQNTVSLPQLCCWGCVLPALQTKPASHGPSHSGTVTPTLAPNRPGLHKRAVPPAQYVPGGQMRW